MLKATNGGGGRGIRQCADDAELLRNYERVVSEASKAFGKPEVFVEKCIVAPRHIEVQVLADAHGNVVHLFERDCSIQRRNQKLIEIAPSPQLSPKQRQRVCTLAVEAARAVGYQNAGTVEFLLDADNQFYFMEMNTRLQVEHTVTETITGHRHRAGADSHHRWASRCRCKQDGIRSSRLCHAEFRINAEDPQNGFLPSFGRISTLLRARRPGCAHRRRDLHRLCDPALLRLHVRQADRLGARPGKALIARAAGAVSTT
jgi:pyruvate carboxylase subunit A